MCSSSTPVAVASVAVVVAVDRDVVDILATIEAAARCDDVDAMADVERRQRRRDGCERGGSRRGAMIVS